ncbi:hypothetical protein BsIDN1_54640 [Bacillus safensis]|uniref:Uncharacterized protein n=1 Tax=Bacillus safensis TaxID=561879 RepID=A0A5S9MJN9_BACIA|nr:hypothetical protein BsIDN1_54640 [Bacillus safensis]
MSPVIETDPSIEPTEDDEATAVGAGELDTEFPAAPLGTTDIPS